MADILESTLEELDLWKLTPTLRNPDSRDVSHPLLSLSPQSRLSLLSGSCASDSILRTDVLCVSTILVNNCAGWNVFGEKLPGRLSFKVGNRASASMGS